MSREDDVPDCPIYLIGAGGHAKVVIAILQSAGHPVVGLFDARAEMAGTHVLGCAVLGPIPAAGWWQTGVRYGLLAIGNNAARLRLAGEIDAQWTRAIHCSAVVHDSAAVGRGTMVSAQAVVQPQASIGEHVIINTAAVVEHDCDIASFVHIGPGSRLCGSLTVGEGAFIGAGSTVIPGCRIGAWSTVGAGSVVIRDVPTGAVVVGNPARPILARKPDG